MTAERLQRRIRFLVPICCLLMAASSIGADRDLDPKTAKIKAAYLLNFLKFTQWPDDSFSDSHSPIVIGVFGDDPMGDILDATVHQKTVDNRSVRVVRIEAPQRSRYARGGDYERAWDRAVDAARQCHLLYIGADDASVCSRLGDQLADATVLTVAEGVACIHDGAMLALDREGNRIVFYADPDRMSSSEIKVSSKLLALAKTVNRDKR